MSNLSTEQHSPFPDPIRVVEAKRNIRRSVTDATVMLVAMAVVFYIIWFQGGRLYRFLEDKWQLGGWIVYALVGLLAVLLGLGMWLYVSDKVRDVLLVRQLNRRGIRGTAVVVGHEKDERGEDEQYFVFYQFSPDFVVKYQDETAGKIWYNLPKDTQLRIVFLKQNPEINKPVKKA
jgi:hypothetical protein